MTEARTIPVTEDRTVSRPDPLAQQRPAVERWLRWSGLLPLPALLLLHLTNELARAFATDVRDVVRQSPNAVQTLAGLGLVGLPLVVHAVLGAWWLVTGRSLPSVSPTPALPRVLSRICAAIAGLFLVWHARAYAAAVWLGEADARDAGFRLLEELSTTRFGVPLSGAGYLFGLLATSTHAGLAVHRALGGEGLLDSEPRRRLSARACAAFGVITFALGAAAVIRVASGVLLR